MKISFILPGIGISGGARVVFEYANNLKSRGHEVSVIYPIFGSLYMIKWYNLKKIIRTFLFGLNRLRKNNKVKWFNLEAKLVKVPIISNLFIEDSDIIVATRWDTAYDVYELRKTKGEKFYLIQGYEIWDGSKYMVDNSYRLPLSRIVISQYLDNIIRNKLNMNVTGKIIHGINFNMFFKEKYRKYGSKRIIMQYSDLDAKGFQDGIKAYNIIKKEIPESKLILFGVKKLKKLPSDIEFFKSVNSDEMRKLYNSCDILLSSSIEEGFGLPPMEAMACGCAVVTTNHGAVPDYILPGITALVSSPKDPTTLAKNAILLLKDEKKLKEFAQKGHEYVKKFTWEKATIQLERLFLTTLESRHN